MPPRPLKIVRGTASAASLTVSNTSRLSASRGAWGVVVRGEGLGPDLRRVAGRGVRAEVGDDLHVQGGAGPQDTDRAEVWVVAVAGAVRLVDVQAAVAPQPPLSRPVGEELERQVVRTSSSTRA